MTDEDWVPPSANEVKLINARRERSDKIAKLMGSYMLKGYKMLATNCTVCHTIELQDKSGKVHCIACEEVDNREVSKDDPVLNPPPSGATAVVPDVPRNRSTRVEVVEAPCVQKHFTPLELDAKEDSELVTEARASLRAVLQKMEEGRKALESSPDENIEKNKMLISLLKDCADCLSSLKKLT